MCVCVAALLGLVSSTCREVVQPNSHASAMCRDKLDLCKTDVAQQPTSSKWQCIVANHEVAHVVAHVRPNKFSTDTFTLLDEIVFNGVVLLVVTT